MRKRKGKFTRVTGLSFFAKIKKDDGEVISKRSPTKRVIFNFAQANTAKFKWIYIRVTYGKPEIYNDGKYTPELIGEMWNAWKMFTEESLIKDALTY